MLEETPLTIEQERNVRLTDRANMLLTQVSFLNYKFMAGIGHGGVYLRARYEEPDVYGDPMDGDQEQLTRRWLLSPDMTDSEIVSTAFKCAITSMEHRTREHFLYKGRRIFGPHFDVEDLVKLCETRESAGGRR